MKKRKYDTKTTLDRPQRWLSSSSGTTTNNNKLKKKTIDNKSGVRRCNYADADYGKQKRNGSQSDIRPNKNSSVDRTAKILSLALPYLDDRKDWNNVCLTSKRIHHKIHDNPCLIFPWPVDIDMKLPTETLQANSRMKVQCSFAPDGKHLICLLCVVSCPGWYNDDDKEVESRHSVSIFHRKDGLVQKIRLKDNMDNGWSDGPCDFRKVVMSSNGCRLFLQRRSSDQIHALSVSEDFKSFDLSDFFDGVSDEIFMNNDFSNTVAVSSDGSKFVGVNTKKGGKFTAVSIDEDTGNCKSLLPTFRSGYHLSIAPLDVSFCPDDDSVAILVDRDVNDSGYGPFMQTVAVFNPKEESAEYYWCDLASSPDRFGFQDYYDGIGIDYSPNGSILAGVHTSGAILWDTFYDYMERGSFLSEHEVSAFTFHPTDENFIFFGLRQKGVRDANIELWDTQTCYLVKSFAICRQGSLVSDIQHIRISPHDSCMAVVSSDGKLSIHKFSLIEE